MARPRLYASAAERQAAYRERSKVIEIRVTAKVGDTLDRLAEKLDISRNELAYNLIAFALANRDWANAPLYARLPGARRNPDDGEDDPVRNPYRVEIKPPQAVAWSLLAAYPSESGAAASARALAVARPFDAVRVVKVAS